MHSSGTLFIQQISDKIYASYFTFVADIITVNDKLRISAIESLKCGAN